MEWMEVGQVLKALDKKSNLKSSGMHNIFS